MYKSLEAEQISLVCVVDVKLIKHTNVMFSCNAWREPDFWWAYNETWVLTSRDPLENTMSLNFSSFIIVGIQNKTIRNFDGCIVLILSLVLIHLLKLGCSVTGLLY